MTLRKKLISRISFFSFLFMLIFGATGLIFTSCSNLFDDEVALEENLDDALEEARKSDDFKKAVEDAYSEAHEEVIKAVLELYDAVEVDKPTDKRHIFIDGSDVACDVYPIKVKADDINSFFGSLCRKENSIVACNRAQYIADFHRINRSADSLCHARYGFYYNKIFCIIHGENRC